jgi:type II restriction/modification system DNA methylase subunit YeeA
LSKLFEVLSSGYREKENGQNKSFKVRHIDSPLFNNAKLHHLHKVKFRNRVWQDIICRLSLSKQQRNRTRGRISYANLGINQLGSVYESLLAYRGFYAEQDYIEVHKADAPNEGTYLVPRMRRDDFQENEILKDNAEHDIITKKGTFVYRLSGRDRQKSASYYTPEVLTRCTVKYTLKPILEKLDKGEMKATELLELKLLEPAMGAAAFHNEMINQLAEAYLTYRQKELNKRVAPDLFKEELQKVKAYIATNNTYGVDLNPTAIELGKLSLWLNVIHKDMETPFFSNRLAVGNAVVGAWLKVYKEKDIAEDLDARGITLARQTKKEWWDIAPRQLEFKPNKEYDKIKHGRRADEIYHFLLPDKNMVPSAGIKMLKAEYETESKAVTKWRKDFCEPL